jgi:DNA-binding CsgD family transcriptional regulator
VAVWLWGGPGWAFGLALHRDRDAGADDDLAILGWLTPLLRACWDMSLWRCARDLAPPGTGSQAGVVLVSTELGPLSSDETAVSLLADTELDGRHLAGRLALRDLVADAPPDDPVTVGNVTLRVRPADQEESLAILVVAPAPAALQVGLTARQLQVLRLSAAGAATKQVARQLGISPRTAEKHLEQAYRRLGVSTRFQAIGAL